MAREYLNHNMTNVSSISYKGSSNDKIIQSAQMCSKSILKGSFTQLYVCIWPAEMLMIWKQSAAWAITICVNVCY